MVHQDMKWQMRAQRRLLFVKWGFVKKVFLIDMLWTAWLVSAKKTMCDAKHWLAASSTGTGTGTRTMGTIGVPVQRECERFYIKQYNPFVHVSVPVYVLVPDTASVIKPSVEEIHQFTPTFLSDVCLAVSNVLLNQTFSWRTLDFFRFG